MNAAPAVSTDRQHQIETPEHVAIGYDLAGPGSRFTAFLIDTLILTGVYFVLGITFLLLVAAGMPPGLLPVTGAVMLLAAFVLGWGYFVYFEGWREGRTPGKKSMNLRVIHEGGYPLTLRGAAVRNLLRIVDSQPFPSWIVGGGFMLFHPRAQRLGDMAAGTIVVRERTVGTLPEEAEAAGPPRLSEREFEVLREYSVRRTALEGDARHRVAERLAGHYARYTVDPAAPGHLLDPRKPAHADALLCAVFADESARRARAGLGDGTGSAAAAALLRRQRGRWAEYSSLLRRARSAGLPTLPEREVSRFAALYREVAADLARARTYGGSPELVYTLERAVGAGHNLLYSPAPRSVRAAWHWLRYGFPSLVRRRALVIAGAALCLFGPAIATFAVVSADPERAHAVVPATMIARAEEGVTRQQEGRGYVEVPEILMPLFSSTLITNNVQVSFMAFAGGIAAGLGTIFVLLTNGVLLGGVAGLFNAQGLNLYLWSFVLPHGVIELTAICIAGGAGLWLGSAFVLPGRRTRRSALVRRGREAVSLIGGVVMLLVIAGLIEGFISPSALPALPKLAFGALTGVVLLAYFTTAGRREAQGDQSNPRFLTSR